MKSIGIDIGTTTISAVAIDTASRELIQSKTISNDSFIRTANDWERIQDVPRIIEKAKALLDELIDRFDNIDSIGLTGQMHGILYLDREGHCISPLYTWQDGSGNLIQSDGKTLLEELAAKYREPIASGYGLVTHLYHLRENLVPAKCASMCTVPDYLGMVLTGRSEPLLHAGMAASLGFFDVKESAFKTEPLRAEGMDLSLLPAVTEDFAVLGAYRGIPVTVAIGDNQASFLGAVGMEEQVLLVNMGTGGQISMLSDQYMEAEDIDVRPFVKGKYLLVGASLCGGRAYAILERFFRACISAACGVEAQQYDVLEKLAQKGLDASDPLKVVTAFGGTRTNPGLRGSISNIGEDNFTPEALTCGVMQGMAQELFDLYCKIHDNTGIRAERMIASGNGLRKNRVLQEIFSRTFQAPLTLAPCEEEAAYGAACTIFLKSLIK